MRGSLALVLLVAACGAAPAPAQKPASARPVKPRAAYAILPGELGDPGIVARIPHHARISRFGRVWLRNEGAPIATGDNDHETRPVVPVLGETRDRLRVVSDQDGARVALWIERRDAARAIIAPVALATNGDAGVFLAPGADVDVGRAEVTRRDITVRDEMIRVRGSVEESVLGAVWVGPVPSEPQEQDAWLDKSVAIRSAPQADAPVIAETVQAVGVHPLGPAHDGFVEVEVQRPAMRVRGFVEAERIAGESYGVGGMGFGGGYGISDTDYVDVPAGACLYDRKGGEVIGVNLVAKQRYGHRRDGEWPSVYVGTAWGIVLVTLHNPSKSNVLITPESCLTDR